MTDVIIDAWMQFPDAAFLRDPIFESLRRWRTSAGGWRRKAAASRHGVLEELRRQGASRVVANAWWGPRGPMLTNDAVAAWSAAIRKPWSASHRSTCCAHGRRSRTEASREAAWAKGLRMLPWLWGLPPTIALLPLYAECIELGIPFCLQVGHSGRCAVEPGRPIPTSITSRLNFPSS